MRVTFARLAMSRPFSRLLTPTTLPTLPKQLLQCRDHEDGRETLFIYFLGIYLDALQACHEEKRATGIVTSSYYSSTTKAR